MFFCFFASRVLLMMYCIEALLSQIIICFPLYGHTTFVLLSGAIVLRQVHR